MENNSLNYTVAQLALDIAISQIGQSESPIGSNSGPMVDKYLKAVGLKPGYPWCQAFVNYCYEQAALQLNIPEPVVNTGGVLDCWNRTKATKLRNAEILKRPDLIKPGDQFIMKLGATIGHTGIIERVSCLPGKPVTLHTIEGNTDGDGGREGFEVARRERRITATMLGVIRYV